jgi:hypothetical protein
LRAADFLTGGRLTAFLPFADLGAGLLAGINLLLKNGISLVEERAIIPADPVVYSAVRNASSGGGRLAAERVRLARVPTQQGRWLSLRAA